MSFSASWREVKKFLDWGGRLLKKFRTGGGGGGPVSWVDVGGHFVWEGVNKLSHEAILISSQNYILTIYHVICR